MLEDIFLTTDIKSLNTKLKTDNGLQFIFLFLIFPREKKFLTLDVLTMLDQYCI